jgi:Zn-dependent peptidase ImmA (M78 family)
MTLPTSLKINGFIFKVKESDDACREGNCYGSMHGATQTIFIDPTATDQKKKETLLHELIHAVAWTSGLSRRLDDSKREEEIVTSLSFGIYQVLSDNGMLTGFGEDNAKI